MANLTEIYNALIDVITDAVYPNGTSTPSIINAAVTRRPGYPDPSRLNALLNLAEAHIGVFAIGNSDKNVTRFQEIEKVISINEATIFTEIINNTVTITGTISVPQSVLIILNKITYSYIVKDADTLADIASNLASLLPNAASNENTITINGNISSLNVRVSTAGQTLLEIKRQTKIFYVSVYASLPTHREILGDAIDIKLGFLKRLYLPGTSACNITYKGMLEKDQFQKEDLYQRDLIYTIEYPTVMSSDYMMIESEIINLSNLED